MPKNIGAQHIIDRSAHEDVFGCQEHFRLPHINLKSLPNMLKHKTFHQIKMVFHLFLIHLLIFFRESESTVSTKCFQRMKSRITKKHVKEESRALANET